VDDELFLPHNQASLAAVLDANKCSVCSAHNDSVASEDEPGAPRYARPFVTLFLAALVFCAVGAVNAWPFSDWDLFSRLRTDRETGWKAVAVDSAGRQHDDPLAALPQGYRGFGSVMADFSGRSSSERNAICAAWLRGATEQFGPSIRVLRIYHLEWLLSDRRGSRAAPNPAGRTLTWICTARGARAES
jgi:hypothetical protein